jgi:HSP20 family protein
MRREMDRLLDDFWARPAREGAEPGWVPPVEIFEADNEVVVRAELPNIDPKQMDISVTPEAITLKGETKHEEERRARNYYRRELRYGSFARALPLPTEVKSAEARATYKDGVLEVRIPKSDRSRATPVKVQPA